MIKKNIKTLLVLFAIVLTASLVSCDPARKYEKEEKASIDAFLSNNINQNYQKQPSGLYYLEVVKGTGLSPVMGDSAYVKYTLMYLDGTVLYSNVSTGVLYKFILGENISGFDEGLTLMAEGKASLLIPSQLGYGAYGVTDDYGRVIIQGYTPLLYDLELVKVIKAAK